MSKPKILITRPDIPKAAFETLKHQCELEIYNETKIMPRETLMLMIVGKDGLLCTSTDRIDKQILEAAGNQLKIISTMSINYDHINLQECKNRNIVVCYTPDISYDSIAEWTIALMLATGRHLLKAAATISKGEWIYPCEPVWLCGVGISNAVVGIVGMNRIGLKVLKRILNFEVKQVLYYDPLRSVKHADEQGAIFAEIDDLLKCSDFVVCLLNLTKSTKNFFCKAKFDLMKKNAVFVNTIRSEVVNLNDLYDFLKNKNILAGALNLTSPEPLSPNNQLLTLDNLIIAPQVASVDLPAHFRMAKLAAENILCAIQGLEPISPIKMS